MLDQHAEEIAKSLYLLAAEKMKPLVVVVDQFDKYVSHHGNLEHYQFPEYSKGDECLDGFPFLVGLEAESHVELPLVTLKNDVVAKVNVININKRRYIILFDANSEFQQHQQAMQGSNETKLLNEKLQNLTKQLQITQTDLEENNQLLELANDAKTRFISSMSHEFRTPISAILGFSDILSEKLSSQDQIQQHAKAIERNASYLLSLIDNVLEHAQLEKDKIIINLGPIDLPEFIESIEQFFLSHAENRKLVFNVAVENNVPQVILVDRIRLQQILINIIGNAFKYTEKGSISVIFSWSDNTLYVSVTDTGSGISREELDFIFQAYRRGQVENIRGAGLGLAISAQLAEKLKGKIEVSSTVGEGSNFTLKIQAPEASNDDIAVLHDNASNILIVEDEADLVDLLSIYLQDQGHRTIIANDGKEALKIFDTETIDLILLDMQLPDINGLDVVAKLKQTDTNVPIIGMSASLDGDTKENALRAGCRNYLTKPVQVSLLNNIISTVLAENNG